MDRAVAVAPVDPSCDWFPEWFSTADVIVFLDGRDWFLEHGSSPSFSTMLGAWNPTEEFVEWARGMGTVVWSEEDSMQSGLGSFA